MAVLSTPGAARRLGMGLAAGAAAFSLIWAVGIEPRLLDEIEVTAAIPGLPPAWEGQRVAALGDFQVGVWYANEDTARRAIARAVEEHPTAVLLLGDYLYHPSPNRRETLAKVKRLLAPLAAADIPAYGVLGNHDYGLDDENSDPPAEVAADVRKLLREVDVTLLENAAVELRLPGAAEPATAPLWLVGIASRKGSDRDAANALDSVPNGAPRIVMMHNPHSFQGLPPGAAPFAIAAHTHGAQVRIPFLPGRSWLARLRGQPAHIAGWAAPEFGASGNHLYVNRGIGFSALPVRFGAPPELTFFTLTRS